MLKQKRYYLFIFAIGAVGYCLLEVLWRGFTHPTMAFAGGFSFVLIFSVEMRLKRLKLLYRAILSGLGITLIEALFGAVFNLKLGSNVWDYSAIPLNWHGQICLLYTVLWCFLSVPLLYLSERIEKALRKQHIAFKA